MNQNLKTFCLVETFRTEIGIEKKISYDIETWSIDRILNKEHFNGKNMQRMGTKTQS